MKTYIYIAGTIFLIGFGYFATENRRMASKILNTNLPLSASKIECESWGFTDTLATCVFEINPTDFESLLEGREFEKRVVSGSSHEMGGGPKLGEDFEVSTLYIANPAEFHRGGHVALVTNKDRSKVSTDIYIE